MSGDENFAARWSRLKRETAKGQPQEGSAADVAPPPAQEEGLGARSEGEAPSPPSGTAKEPPFDPATLPSVDSIVAGTDIRDFLRSGVPAELTRAALRKAWLADPAIRNFIEMAENQWDFTDPNAIPGFGPLRASDDIGELVRQAMGTLPKLEPAPSSTDIPPPTAAPGAPVSMTAQAPGIPEGSSNEPNPVGLVNEPADIEIVAVQHADSPPSDSSSNRRAHGRALPK